MLKYLGWLICVLPCTLAAFEGSLFQIRQREAQVTSAAALIELIQLIQKQSVLPSEMSPVNTLIIVMRKDCCFAQMLHMLHAQMWPLLLVTPLTALTHVQAPQALMLACASPFNETSQPLRDAPAVKRLIQLQSNDLSAMRAYCAASQSAEHYNALVVMLDFWQTGVYYNCRMQPAQTAQNYQLKSVHQRIEPYSAHYLNMQQMGIRTEFDYYPHRTMLDDRLTAQGHALRGYLANLLLTFAERHNATLLYKRHTSRQHFIGNVKELTMAGELDVGTTLAPIRFNLSHYSYPYEIGESCFMTPIPKELRMAALLARIFSWQIILLLLIVNLIFAMLLTYTLQRTLSWSHVLLNDKSLRGTLGQCFPMPPLSSGNAKYVCMLLCLSSMIVITTYNAHMQSYLTKRPKEQDIVYYEDIERLQLKLCIMADEWPEVVEMNATVLSFRHLYDIVTLKEFFERRDSFDERCGYPVHYTRWLIFEQQLRRKPRLKFEFNRNFCFTHFTINGLPIRAQLPYRHQLERHILDVRELGLYECWIKESFYHMKRLGYIKDVDMPVKSSSFVVFADFKVIWVFYIICTMVAFGCFIGELVLWRWKLGNRT